MQRITDDGNTVLSQWIIVATPDNIEELSIRSVI